MGPVLLIIRLAGDDSNNNGLHTHHQTISGSIRLDLGSCDGTEVISASQIAIRLCLGTARIHEMLIDGYVLLSWSLMVGEVSTTSINPCSSRVMSHVEIGSTQLLTSVPDSAIHRSLQFALLYTNCRQQRLSIVSTPYPPHSHFCVLTLACKCVSLYEYGILVFRESDG